MKLSNMNHPKRPLALPGKKAMHVSREDDKKLIAALREKKRGKGLRGMV